MNGLRLVAVGRYTPTEEKLTCDPIFADTWHTGLSNSVDRLLTDAQIAAEHEDLVEAREDEEWIRRGC